MIVCYVLYLLFLLVFGKVSTAISAYTIILLVLAMVDYLSRENDVPLCTKYNDIRVQKLQDVIYPAGAVLLDTAAKNDKHCSECMKNAIPEFLHFNIVESEVRNVY